MKTTIDALVEALETITLACHLEALTPGKGTHVDESVLRVANEALAQARAEQAETSRFGSPELQAAILANLAPPAALKADAGLTKAASDVLAERQRQISAEGWTIEHDDEHDDGALSAAASTYALAASDRLNPVRRGIEFGGGRRGPSTWPWSRDSWKYGTPRRMLVKAGALVLAEIERLDRAARSKT